MFRILKGSFAIAMSYGGDNGYGDGFGSYGDGSGSYGDGSYASGFGSDTNNGLEVLNA